MLHGIAKAVTAPHVHSITSARAQAEIIYETRVGSPGEIKAIQIPRQAQLTQYFR